MGLQRLSYANVYHKSGELAALPMSTSLWNTPSLPHLIFSQHLGGFQRTDIIYFRAVCLKLEKKFLLREKIKKNIVDTQYCFM